MAKTMTDTTLREQAITGEVPMSVSLASDCEVITEAYVKNKGLIMGCVTNLPTPVLAILKSLAQLMLIPLHVIRSLPLGTIYNGLNDFANGNSCQPSLPLSTSDCAPSKIV